MPMSGRSVALGLVAGLLAGSCAASAGITEPALAITVQDEPAAPVQLELPPQTLPVGECGVFFWGRGEGARFLMFENLSRGQTRLIVDGAVREFWSSAQADSVVPGIDFYRRFTDATTQLDVEITGAVHGGAAEGLRIAPTIMRVHRPDGQQVVIPMAGHYACRLTP